MCELFACPDDVPTLENFAYGDPPTREDTPTGLLADVLEASGRRRVLCVSTRHDAFAFACEQTVPSHLLSCHGTRIERWRSGSCVMRLASGRVRSCTTATPSLRR